MFRKVIDYYRSLSVPAKAAIVYLIVLMLQKSLAFVTSPIFARLLTVSEYGEVSVFFSWQELVGIVAMFCLQGGVFNNGMVDFPEDRNQYTFSMLVLSNILTIVTAIIFFPINNALGNFIELDVILIALMFAYFIFQPALGFWTIRQRYEYKYKLSSLVTLVYCFSAPIISIMALVILDGNPVYERLFGYEGTLIVIYLPFYIYVGYKAHFKVKVSYFWYALKFNLFLIPHYFSMYVLNSSDRIMIKNLLGAKEAGFYSMAYSISALVVAITTAIHQAMTPYIYEKCKEKNYKKVKEVTSGVVVMILVITIIIIMMAPEILLMLSTREYYEAIYVIPSIVSGIFFQALYSIYACIVYYYKKPKYVMVGSVVSALGNIILNYIFIPHYGYIAAGYTTLFSYVLQACIDIWAVKKVVGSKPYDLKLLGITSLVAIVVAIVCPVFYQSWIIRYGILMILGIVIIAKRKRVFEMISIIRNR